MKLIISFWCSLFLLFITPLNAQDTPQKRYDRESIFLQQKFFGGTKYVQDGVEKPVGFFFNDLKKELEVSPNAVVLLKKSRKNQIWAGITAGLSVVFLTSALADNDGNEVLWASTGAAFGIASGILAVRGSNQFNKSIWLYNREVVQGNID